MANNVKKLLDDIIGGGSSDNDTGNAGTVAKSIIKPAGFNSDNFREKLSLCVLKDIISSMMHDETKDVNGMIDEAIMKHIHDDYKGTCFGYLCKARDRLNSPILGDIVQEIEDKTAAADKDVETGDEGSTVSFEEPEKTTNDILGSVSNYAELRQKLKDVVSKKVVDDVSKVITKSNDAPVFDNIDKKLKKVDDTNSENDSQESENPGFEDDVASESVIMRMTSSIVTEYACNRNPISTDEGMNRAIITYCLGELDALFDFDRSRSIVGRYL
jgi:hypothetical protein